MPKSTDEVQDNMKSQFNNNDNITIFIQVSLFSNVHLLLACSVLGTAGSDSGMELLMSIGVKEIFNHKSEGYTKEIMV